MCDEERFDAIVIGAGPAGSACAYVLAKAGKSVLLVERGVSAGSKNVTGGRVYTYALELIGSGLYHRAPLERKVVQEQIMMLGQKSHVSINYADFTFGEDIPQSFTVLRAPFDEWFAGEAEAQGALFAPGVRVDQLLDKNGKIVGIKAGNDEIHANVVIAADGVNSIIAQNSGLVGGIEAHSVGIGVKEIIELPDDVIQARFNLAGNEGAARVAIGCTEGISGGMFLYTNRGSISLGMVFNPQQVARHGKRIHEMMQDLKLHPAIYPLIEGGTTVEYAAHLVPEQGLGGVPSRLYRDGLLVVGDAAGFVINTGTIIRGIDLAIVSGLAAANAVIRAEASSQAGVFYMKELEELLLPAMRVFKGWPDILSIPRLATEYPKIANDVMKYLFTVDAKTPQKMTKAVMEIVKRHVSFSQLIADGWKGFRSI